MNQKRNSVDGASQARRAGFADQTKPPGFFGGLWHRYVDECYFVHAAADAYNKWAFVQNSPSFLFLFLFYFFFKKLNVS